MKNLNPLAAVVSILLVGTVISAVEYQSSKAAIALVVLLLLGIITFNAQEFSVQSKRLINRIYAKPLSGKGGGRRTNKPSKAATGR